MPEQNTSTTERRALNSTAAPNTPATPTTPTGTVLNTEQAAQYLNVKASTMEQWRWQGKGPRFCKLSRAVRYRKLDLDAYLEEGVFSSTTEAQAAV